MKWTKEVPSKPGYYWYQYDDLDNGVLSSIGLLNVYMFRGKIRYFTPYGIIDPTNQETYSNIVFSDTPIPLPTE